MSWEIRPEKFIYFERKLSSLSTPKWETLFSSYPHNNALSPQYGMYSPLSLSLSLPPSLSLLQGPGGGKDFGCVCKCYIPARRQYVKLNIERFELC
jgi:hypothetical protein